MACKAPAAGRTRRRVRRWAPASRCAGAPAERPGSLALCAGSPRSRMVLYRYVDSLISSCPSWPSPRLLRWHDPSLPDLAAEHALELLELLRGVGERELDTVEGKRPLPRARVGVLGLHPMTIHSRLGFSRSQTNQAKGRCPL